ncbi:N-acetyl-1-D-myo-inositol-2-amino-2-deoxy-alpha-D-glucopyranoside deacetylase [Pseudonocardia xishanensis]|uniref:N-acetyl-1-D-myo-inositol-2-amino-2-deoxy-alpha- D-glucopyranoside deacetylase n=1 Tax=Pseudonocardia xishanensis TaxID=630995 RepID=UPI0031E54871
MLFVHAHPDDETLSTGGAIARYAADPSVRCVVVTCTLGEEGEVIPPALRELAPDRADQLGGYRIGELAGALAALGGPEHRFLGGVARWRDSGMGHGEGTRAVALPEVHPRALTAPGGFDLQVDQLRAIVDEVRPDVLVSYADDGGYGHPDHVRAHALTHAVADGRRVFHAVRSRSVLEAGIAGLTDVPFRMPEPDELPSVPDAVVTTRLDVSAYRSQLVAAMRAHATQVAVADTAYAMSNDVAQPYLPVEEYVLATPGEAPADDLLGGPA